MNICGITSNSKSLDTLIENNLSRASENEAVGNAVGSRLGSIEDALMELYSMPEKGKVNNLADFAQRYGLSGIINPSGDNSVEGLRGALGTAYQRALRAYEAFMQLTRNAHETMMRAIQNLRIG